METVYKTPYHHRVTQRKKEANDFEWYKHHIDSLDRIGFSSVTELNGVSEFRNMQSNYDLFNNIIDPEEFKYICKPYGEQVGDLPATFTNRDIMSGKIKVLLGIEMRRPFSWKVAAINEEATTRKEQHEFGLIKDYVIGEIMQPITAEIKKRALEQQQGRQLTPEEQQKIMEQVQQEIESATPPEVRRYMERKHQDPAEALAHQLLEYLVEKLNIKDKFNDGWKHGLLSGKEIFWVGEGIDSPIIRVINPLHFDHDRSSDIKYIEDGDWACAEYFMTPSQIVSIFGSDLTEEEIDKIYAFNTEGGNGLPMADETFQNYMFTFNGQTTNDAIRVLHTNFKSLRKMGFLTYLDEAGQQQMIIVDENYKLIPENGDIAIEWEWIPEVHEGYKIAGDIYKLLRPVPGQFNDINNLYECKLSYKGAVYDNMNSISTSLADRMKPFQFYYNIIMYRIEQLMASDKGKWVLLNLNMLPVSEGINIDKFLYYADAMKIGFLNPNEEANKNRGTGNIGEAAKEIDMSLVSDIQKYIALAEYIEMRCGATVGITKEMEGQTPNSNAVTNTQLNYTQSSYIIEPYFELHNQIKRNVLESLIEVAKTYYSGANVDKLTYVVDDFSTKLLTLDKELLDMSTYSLFVSNSSKAFEAKQAVQQLSQAAMQNQKAELSDIVRIIRSESVQEAEELLITAENNAHRRNMELQQMNNEAKKQEMEALSQMEDKRFEHEKELVVLKERERRETEIQKQVILSLGFNEDKDLDDDGTPDVLEVAKFGVEARIKERKQQLDEEKFAYQKKKDKTDEELQREKLTIDRKKANKPSSK